MNVLLQSLLAVLLAVTCCSAEKKRYDGYQLYRVYPAVKSQTDAVFALQKDGELDFWYEGRDRFDILVPPHKLGGFEQQLIKHEVKYEIANRDIQRDIDIETFMMMAKNVKAGQVLDYDSFNTLDNILAELDSLASRCPRSVQCETFVIGQSYEGRPIKGLHIFRQGTGRKAIWLDATIHAREWLATATHLKIMSHLVDTQNDANVDDLLDKYDFWLIPVSNPDGYSWTHESDRLWRKSRNVNENSPANCLGTDLNRNYAHEWANAGSSNLPCGETYHGSSAGSEPETQAVQGALVEHGKDLLFSIHFHTYGSLWLIPWGSVNEDGSCKYAEDDAEMMVVANLAADAIQNTYNIGSWARGNSCTTIYPAAGITMDFSKGVAGVKYTVTPELRGNNFVVLPTQIQPSFVEVWNGVLTMIRAIERLES